MADSADSADAADGGERWGVYLHFPWCARVCPYCDFNVYQAGDLPHAAYADAVLAQWRHDRPLFPANAPDTLFLGGGTPSLWDPAEVARIVDEIGATWVSAEANPEDASGDRWSALRDAGVARLSLGVQSFEDGVLATLGRVHTAAQARTAVDLAQRAGFARVSLDLIFGVPGQRAWGDTVAQAVASGVGHVSAYGLTIEPGTRFSAQGTRTSGEASELAMLREAVERLEAAGLQRYEVSNFARPGERSRHNELYWQGRPWLGLGAGAHSHLPGKAGARRWVTARKPRDYLALASAGAVEQGEDLGPDDVLRERLLMGLRLVEGVALSDPRLDGELRRLRDAALLAPASGDGALRATPQGMEVLDALIAALDGALGG